METSFFQMARLLMTVGVIWLIGRKIHGYREASGGLNAAELTQFGQAAVAAAGMAMFMAILWSGNFCDGIAGVLLALIDNPDNRPLQEDPMDKLSRLVHEGRIRRARRFCKRMIRRHEGSRVALESLLTHLADRKEGKILVRPPRISGGK